MTQKKSADEVYTNALKEARITKDQVEKIAVHGSDKEFIDISHIQVNDIKAIGKAAIFYFPSARTVIDIGGEEGRAT